MNIMLAINFCDVHWLIIWLLPFILGWLSSGIFTRRRPQTVGPDQSLIKKQQDKVAALESDLSSSRDKLHSLTDSLDVSRRKVTELEGQLALELGARREIEEGGALTSASSSNEGETHKLRERIAQLEGELAVTKGPSASSVSTDVTEGYRQKITQLEAELAMAKGSIREYEEVKGGSNVTTTQSTDSSNVGRSFGVISPTSTSTGLTNKAEPAVQKTPSTAEPVNVQRQAGVTNKLNSGQSKESTPNTGGAVDKTSIGQGIANQTTASPTAKEPKAVSTSKTIESHGVKKASSSGKSVNFKSARSGKFKNVKEDDLTAIEGIGPKMAELLRANGINSWERLSQKTPKQIRELLSTYGNKYNNINPSTWPRQANLAAGNNWTRLQKLQDDLDGGKAKSSPKSKAPGKKIAAKKTPAKRAEANKRSGKSTVKVKTKPAQAKTTKRSDAKSKSTKTAKSKIKTKSTAKTSLSNIKSGQAKRKSVQAVKSKTKPSAKISKRKSKGSSISSKLKSDNFQIIEGIGPKMNSILNQNGVKTWTGLASKSPAQLERILDKYGDRYRIIDPSAWPRQASYASNGQWNKLIKYQKKDGSDSKAEKVFSKLGITSAKADDFKLIEGIGPKIEGLIKKAGINSMGKLSKASTKRLQTILDKAGKRYGLADPSTWAKQAGLIHKGKMKELERLQAKLKGGR